MTRRYLTRSEDLGWLAATGRVQIDDDEPTPYVELTEDESRDHSDYQWAVVDDKDSEVGDRILVLAYFVSPAEASEFIATLPEYESGRYGIDGPVE